ncbi:MAG: 3-dehydroquinate synthase [Acidobacteria bacterium]|nr:3-dehydroquinate synthase [Acidobacteriota bacterium]
MRLATPPGFPTEVFVQEVPAAELLPSGPWALVGDAAVRESWRAAAMPEPPCAIWEGVDESRKRLETILPWLEDWSRIPLHRDATLVAVGGGVLTDLAGLAASLYMRGIAWQAWPTTVLSMADAGLGGKTGADLPTGKNLVGAFHPPSRMVACTGFLATLPARQAESGRQELVKTALLLGDQEWAQEVAGEGPVKAAWIERALAFKAEVVHRDPMEHGERRVLNLGHTLGHAVESASGYALLHGEAVGIGLLASCLLAESEGLRPFPASFLDRLAARLAPLAPQLPTWEALLPWLTRDKKGTGLKPAGSEGVQIRCILPRPGESALQQLLPPSAWAEPYARVKHLLQGDPARA